VPVVAKIDQLGLGIAAGRKAAAQHGVHAPACRVRPRVAAARGALVVQQEGACQCQNGQGAQLRRLEQAVAVAFDQAGIQIRIGIRRFPSAA